MKEYTKCNVELVDDTWNITWKCTLCKNHKGKHQQIVTMVEEWE